MKLLSTALLAWAAITLGGFLLALVVVLLAEMYEKTGWFGVVTAASVLSGIVAFLVGLMLRVR